MIGFGYLAAATALSATTALAVPTPTQTATPSPSPTPSATAAPTPTVAASTVGGPRMAERGLVFGGVGQPPPTTSGASYVVADATTGAILAAKDPHGRYRPASTLKTLLALTMLPRLDKNATYTTQRDDTEVEGTRVGMVEHQTYPIDLLWYGLILRSGNDAANALAKAGAGGDLAKGVRMMNAEARRLQAYDTTAVNPSGLDEDGQYSSAYDLALWGRAALQRGDMRRYMKAVKIVFPGNLTKTGTPKTRKSFDVFTGNRLILRGYDGVIGVKNGYTSKARNTNIAAAERDGRTYVASLMASPGAITEDSEKLLDWAFEHGQSIVPVGTLVDPVTPALLTEEDGYVPQVAGPEQNLAAGLIPGSAHDPAAEVAHGARFSRTGMLAAADTLAVASLGALGVRRRRRRRNPIAS